jgi:hypothetical protein
MARDILSRQFGEHHRSDRTDRTNPVTDMPDQRQNSEAPPIQTTEAQPHPLCSRGTQQL